MKIFEVSGAFVIPGTRKQERLAIRAVARSAREGSRMLAPFLSERFARHLPDGVTFSPSFALCNFRWANWSGEKQA